MTRFFQALPDVHATEQDLSESGDTVAARFVVEGTHRAVLWGVSPTGHKVRWDAIMIYRFADGKISEQWAAEDWTAILHGIGVVRPPWLK
jgi:predicted ester cyclase